MIECTLPKFFFFGPIPLCVGGDGWEGTDGYASYGENSQGGSPHPCFFHHDVPSSLAAGLQSHWTLPLMVTVSLSWQSFPWRHSSRDIGCSVKSSAKDRSPGHLKADDVNPSAVSDPWLLWARSLRIFWSCTTSSNCSVLWMVSALRVSSHCVLGCQGIPDPSGGREPPQAPPVKGQFSACRDRKLRSLHWDVWLVRKNTGSAEVTPSSPAVRVINGQL